MRVTPLQYSLVVAYSVPAALLIGWTQHPQVQHVSSRPISLYCVHRYRHRTPAQRHAHCLTMDAGPAPHLICYLGVSEPAWRTYNCDLGQTFDAVFRLPALTYLRPRAVTSHVRACAQCLGPPNNFPNAASVTETMWRIRAGVATAGFVIVKRLLEQFRFRTRPPICTTTHHPNDHQASPRPLETNRPRPTEPICQVRIYDSLSRAHHIFHSPS
jgi:hypothetical protein